MNDEPKFYRSVSRLAAECGATRDQVHQAMQKLKLVADVVVLGDNDRKSFGFGDDNADKIRAAIRKLPTVIHKRRQRQWLRFVDRADYPRAKVLMRENSNSQELKALRDVANTRLLEDRANRPGHYATPMGDPTDLESYVPCDLAPCPT